MKIYLSQAFSGAANWSAARQRSEELGNMLQAHGFEVYLPHVNTDPLEHAGLDARTVFERDLAEIHQSEILLALLDEPSHGVGAEIMLALNGGMIVLGVLPRGKEVSRFIRGLLEDSEKGRYFEYDRLDEIVEELTLLATSKLRILSQTA